MRRMRDHPVDAGHDRITIIFVINAQHASVGIELHDEPSFLGCLDDGVVADRGRGLGELLRCGICREIGVMGRRVLPQPRRTLDPLKIGDGLVVEGEPEGLGDLVGEC